MIRSENVLRSLLVAVAIGVGVFPSVTHSQCLPDTTYTGEAAYDYFGRAVSGAGDVDNDGYDDLIMGSRGSGGRPGRAYVYSGKTRALLHTFNGETTHDWFGFSLSGAGDVNKDGYADVIVGAWTDNRAYVFSGQTGLTLYTFTSLGVNSNFGYSVSGAGDVDNDGYADVIVGAYSSDEGGNNAGRAYVYSGQTGSPLHTFTGEAANDWFGLSASGAGDVNNDGFADLIVGAWLNDAGGSQAGQAYVYSGHTGALLYTFTGAAAGDQFGHSVSGAGDVNNDGIADLIVGGLLNDAGGSNAGRAYVYTCNFNQPPIAVCQDITIVAGENCTADASINNGSDDPDGDPITLTQTPPGPYPIGSTIVTLVVSDDKGASSSCQATVTVTGGIGSLAGQVSADCPAPATPLYGVHIDVFGQGSGNLVGTAVTDVSGAYSVGGLEVGNHIVTIVTPLGYSTLAEEVALTVACGETVTADFALNCEEITASPRKVSFWKHQVAVALRGKGKYEIDGPTLCSYLDEIEQHFNSNGINQVAVYEPPPSGDCADKLLVAKDLLNHRGDVGMRAKAKQQLTGLLLNVASARLSLTEIISADGANVSQAITYSDNLIDDPAGDHHLARDICKKINKNKQVEAGVIPISTANIAYRNAVRPGEYALSQNYPNPFNPSTKISLVLTERSNWTIEIYNLMGQKVESFSGVAEAGEVVVEWNAAGYASGVYLYKASAGAFSRTRKMTLLK
ncbi:MAG: FG-GAP-like repeat-containing protein [Candidatus Zixiibacteriota bacterium]